MPGQQCSRPVPRVSMDDEEGVTIRRDFSEVLELEKRAANQDPEVGAEALPSEPINADDPEEASSLPPATARKDFLTRGGRRVVVVEMDGLFAEQMQSELGSHGWAVSVILDGKDAVGAIQRDPPDLILLCVELTGVSGYLVCNRLKSDPALSKIPLVLFTRADDYLCKPFAIEDLLQKLDVLTDPEKRARMERFRPAKPPQGRNSMTSGVGLPSTGRPARWRWFVLLSLLTAVGGFAALSYHVLRRPSPASGALVIHLIPKTARVLINGVLRAEVGETRVLNDLPAGRLTLEISHSSCRALVKEVRITSGQVLVTHVELPCDRVAKEPKSRAQPPSP
jgi:CheY-like chemotaxis protein